MARGKLGSAFGGVWIGAADDRVKLGVVGGQVGTVRQMVDAVGLSGAVDQVVMRYQMAELEAANDWLGDRIAEVNVGTPWTLTAGLRPDINAIELQTPRSGPLTAAQQALVDTARARLGAMLRVGDYAGQPTPSACVYPYCDPPLRAGIRILNTVTGGGCTGGFIARSRSDGILYQFTAGHCAYFAGTNDWLTYFPDGTGVGHIIGPIHNWVFSGSGDMAIMRVNRPIEWAPRAWVYVTDGPDTARDTTYNIADDKGSTLGQRICITGGFYGRSDCGTVTRINVTATYGGVTVHHLGEGSYCGTTGDSGAPIYASHIAYGLNVALASECHNFYQSIPLAEDALNVNVAHGPS